jgi:hypothetical protein
VRLRLRPQLVIVLALEHLAAHAGNSLHSARALHNCNPRRQLDASASYLETEASN